MWLPGCDHVIYFHYGEGSGLLRALLRAGVRGSGQDTPGASTAVAKVAELL